MASYKRGVCLCHGVGDVEERERPKTNDEKRGKNLSLPSVKPMQRKKMVVYNNLKITSFPFYPFLFSINYQNNIVSYKTCHFGA